MSDPAPPIGTRAPEPSSPVDYLRGTLRGWPRAVVRWVLLQAIRPFIRLEIIGLDRVPATGSFLFVANHLHNADPLLLETSLRRPVHFMAKQELFRHWPLAWGLRLVGAFPVDRGRFDRVALRQAEARLASGVPVGIFPEGTRSKSGMLQPAFAGAGLIAIRTRAIILPASIAGTESLPLNGVQSQLETWKPLVRRARVTVRIGVPFALPEIFDGAGISSGAATDLIMTEVARLLPAGYRGAYAALADQQAGHNQPAAGSPSHDADAMS